ncbi:hypothetical protein Leryth_007564 [Lithospermum erythrorhizon]|nr:hypothetical protein Leryth_007564 [Lithospermum erythrorhizon]
MLSCRYVLNHTTDILLILLLPKQYIAKDNKCSYSFPDLFSCLQYKLSFPACSSEVSTAMLWESYETESVLQLKSQVLD